MKNDKQAPAPVASKSDRMKALLARAGLGVAVLTPILLPFIDCGGGGGKFPQGAAE